MTKAAKAGAPSGLRLLTRAEDILGADDTVREEVPTPEWGAGTGVLVQSMNATQRLAYEQAGRTIIREDNGAVRSEVNTDWDYRLALVVCSVVNEAGDPVFSAAQFAALAEKNAAPLERIAEVARRLSRLRSEDREELAAGLKVKGASSPSG